MAQSITKYSEIQNDELEALRSIYMEDFSEEGVKTGAWNKIIDRAFKIRIKPISCNHSKLAITLAVTLPATYPKTLPRLEMVFNDSVLQDVQEEALNLLKNKPKELLGSEMIFEIATALQDILDRSLKMSASGDRTGGTDQQNAPNLHQEREIQEAAINQKSKDAEENKFQTQKEANEEEQQLLSYKIEQETAKIGNRKNKQPPSKDMFEQKDNPPGCTEFDQPITVMDMENVATTFHAVHQKVEYRKGPVSKVFTVHAIGSRPGSAPFLALKECYVGNSIDDSSMKEFIQDLESDLDLLKHLIPHPNILKPLNFNIQRNLVEEASVQEGWNISILTTLASQGSVKGLLNTINTLNSEVTRAWAIQLLEGLDFYHRHGIVHARVHVNNILLEQAETGNIIVKLADGVYQHKLHSMSNRASDDHSRADTWTAPEIINNPAARPIAATDVWDLGVVFMQMIFGIKIISQHVMPVEYLVFRDISRSLKELLQHMTTVDFRKRKSAFDLKMFGFFRDEEAILRGSLSPHLATENLITDIKSSKLSYPRRDSMPNPPNASRYLNDFEEIGRLGRGGYGEVVKARHRLENQAYAIKKIRQASASALNKVLSEIVVLSQLNHPNVVRYFTAWTETDGLNRLESSHSSSSGESILSLVNGDREGFFTKSSGGLDFIGADPPEIVFGYDNDEEDSGLDTNDDAKIENGFQDLSEQESESSGGEEDEEESDEEKDDDIGELGYSKRRHPSSHESAVETTLYIQMQYCERQTLRDLIRNGLHSKPKECWRLFRQTLHGLVHIHASSIVHRDLKPENIFIDHQNDVRIGDFGLARPGDQSFTRQRGAKDVFASFTKSVGTAFYVAPEVRSAEKGRYNEKADMYSLGIILFEMCLHMETGMERAHNLGKIRREDHVLPPSFDDPEKSTQGEIILSLIKHRPSDRPSSSELLSSGHVPAQPEDELIRAMIRHLRNPKSTVRRDLLDAIFAEVNEEVHDETQGENRPDVTRVVMGTARNNRLDDSDSEDPEPDPARVLEELAFDFARPHYEPEEIHIRGLVRRRLISVFRHHGAVEVSAPLWHSYSKFYSNYTSSAFKVLRPDNRMMQAPYDLTLPHAKYLATEPHPVRKSFTFGDVWRDMPAENFPKVMGELDFNIVSEGYLDHTIREAETIKTVDEVIDAFPSLAAAQLCYHINHSRILDAILKFCRIDRFKRPAVKDEISKLNFNDWTWFKLKHNLRAPPLSIAATSLEELQAFDFREPFEIAIPRLRSILRDTSKLEEAFAQLHSIITDLGHLNVKRSIYISPLGCFNEKFFRGEFLFQCIYDNKKRDVFAAGGRYDRLVGYFRINPKIPHRHAVGFSMNWQVLCTSMLRYHQKALTKLKSDKVSDNEGDSIWTRRRCDVLVDSFDRELLFTTGVDIVAQLWSNDISAELGIDIDFQVNTSQSLAKEFRDTYSWIILIKSDGLLRAKSCIRKEEAELTKSELLGWLRSAMRDRDRQGGKREDRLRLHRLSSQPESSSHPGDREADVRVLMSQNRGKKANRRTIVEEAQSQVDEVVRRSLDGPAIAVIETKDATFEGLRGTLLSDPETWKRFIQNAPPNERQYLGQVHQLLKGMAEDAKPASRNAFIYNFRTKNCIPYDFGPVP